MRRADVRRSAGFVVAMVLLGACAARQPGSAGAAPPPASHGVPAAATRQRVLAPFDSTQIDTVPSVAALQVLNAIPEPLASVVPGAKPPPAPMVAAGPDSLALKAPVDTTGAEADTSDVPAPEPVAPLGDAPGTPTETALPEFAPPTDGAAAGGAGAVGAGAAGATGAGTQTAPPAAPAGPCWHVQVASWPDQAKSESLRKTAESLLLVPMTLVNADGRWKVRTRDCLDADAAENLRHRAEDSGFTGAFRTTDTGTTPPAKPAPKKPAKKTSGTR